MKKKTNKKTTLVVSAILLAVFCFLGGNLFNKDSAQEKDTTPAYIELRVGKKEILVSSTDGTKNRQKALVGNLEVSFTDANGNNSGWFRATEKSGTYNGTIDNFSFVTEDGYEFQIIVDGTYVQAAVEKEDAYASISFTMNTHSKETNKENSTPSHAVGFEEGTTEEERNELRQEVAKDDNAVDVDEKGNVVGKQDKENSWTPDKAQDSVDKGEATIVPSESTEEGSDDVITKDDEGYHLEEVRPESDPEEEEEKEEPKEEVVSETAPENNSSEIAPAEPQPAVKDDEEVKVEEPKEEVKPEEPKEEVKPNTYERVSVLISKGNVVSAFSNNGGSGKLNLIVDSINGNVYTCHTKDGAVYTVIIENGVVSFNGETYFC